MHNQHLQKLGFCQSSLSPECGAEAGGDTVELIGDPGCPVKVTLVIIYAKDDTLLAVCHSTVLMHLFLTLSVTWKSDSVPSSATAGGSGFWTKAFSQQQCGLCHWAGALGESQHPGEAAHPMQRLFFSCSSGRPVFLSHSAIFIIFTVAEIINVKDL